jgi:HAE1 family hydrophobic/amphiphilic exporter-1
LGALLLKPRDDQSGKGLLGRFFGGFNRVFARITDGYTSVCSMLIRKLAIAILLLVGFVVLAGGLGKVVPSSFLPDEDQGYFIMNLQLPEAASLQRTAAVMKQIDEILKNEPGIQHYSAIAGYSLLSQVSSTRSGLYFCQLNPYDQRKKRQLFAPSIIESVNRKLAALPDAQAFAFPPPAIPGIGQAGGFDLMVQDKSGQTVDYLWDNTQKFLAAAKKRPELGRMNILFNPATPQLFASLDHAKVFKLGLSTKDVYGTLQALLGGLYVNQFNRFGRVWKVFVEAEPAYRLRPEDVGQFYVRNKAGAMVPLSTLLNLQKASGPEFTTRFNEYRSIEVFGSPARGYSAGQAMNAVTQVANQVLPRDMGIAWNGMSYQQAQAGGAAGVFALSLMFVFLILAALYESWSLPFSVLLSTPVAVCGAFFGLWARKLDNDIYAQIGLIMLIGLSAKNAILIVEFARAELEKGESVVQAALNGARLRLRPILMTSFAFIFGLLPLWTAIGAGAAARRLIGSVTIVGMIFSSGFAILLVPALFVLVERLSGSAKNDASAAETTEASTSSEPARKTG